MSFWKFTINPFMNILTKKVHQWKGIWLSLISWRLLPTWCWIASTAKIITLSVWMSHKRQRHYRAYWTCRHWLFLPLYPITEPSWMSWHSRWIHRVTRRRYPMDHDVCINGKTTKEYTDRDWNIYRNHRIRFIFQGYNLIPEGIR